MWKLILIAAIAFAVWKFYPMFTTSNVNNAEQNALNGVKHEKTIFKVNDAREQNEKEVQNVLNNQ